MLSCFKDCIFLRISQNRYFRCVWHNSLWMVGKKVNIYYTRGKCKRKSSCTLCGFLGITATICPCSEWANQRLPLGWGWWDSPPLAALPSGLGGTGWFMNSATQIKCSLAKTPRKSVLMVQNSVCLNNGNMVSLCSIF